MKWGAVLSVLCLGAAATMYAGWVISDVFESDNEFCVSCHLNTTSVLHAAKSEDFRARPAVNLAGLHAEREKGFRCIDCHGGASFENKLRVKTVAARDALFYLLGAFEEPSRMEHALWDEDCAQCHGTYASERDDDFHATDDHNQAGFEYRCVDCHRSHSTQGSAKLDFLSQDVVLPVCRQCHEEF